ncbi:MAG: NCS2 family permease [Lachnospiraceae bacterium]|nr:NCS2 family permease [Lachnospiraceae bacterium]
MEKIFKLKQNGTDVKTEILAGITTFFTMAYIIALNPNILTGFDVGSPLWNGVFMATCIASAIGTICMAFLANKPFVMAPGMGLNSFFALVVADIVALTGMTYLQSFQSALCIMLFEGVVFLVLSIFNVREKIVQAIPIGIRIGITPAIGLMIMNIGFGSNVAVYDANGHENYVMRDFFGSLTPTFLKRTMGESYPVMILTVVTVFVGFFAIVLLSHHGVKAAVLLGMLISSAIYWTGEALMLGVNPFSALEEETFVPPFQDMSETTLFRFNFDGLMQLGWITVVTLIVTFCVLDMFDTIGTLIGAAQRTGMLDEKGSMPQMKEALASDAIGTIVGSFTGTSTVTTFLESNSGVEAGGRTGLTALTAGVLFLVALFLAPIAAIIPAAATSAALIYVGVLMLSGLKALNFDDLTQTAPVFIMLLAMPVSGSIGHGIGLALITYTVLMLFTGRRKEISPLTFVLSIVFLVKFFYEV